MARSDAGLDDAQLTRPGDQAGLVREGYLADLLLVRAAPVADVSVLQHEDNLAMVMRGGALHQDPRGGRRPDHGLIRAGSCRKDR